MADIFDQLNPSSTEAKKSDIFDQLNPSTPTPKKEDIFEELNPSPQTQEAIPEEKPVEKKQSFFDRLGQAASYQMQSGGSSGAPSLSPQQAKKVALEVGTIAAVDAAYAPISAYVGTAKYAPRILKAITGVFQAATTGVAIPTVESLVETGKLPPKEQLGKEALTWAAIDLSLQAVFHLAGMTRGAGITSAAEKGKALNPIQRKLESIERVIKASGSTEGEIASATRAKNRLTGKYNIEKGIEKIAKDKNIQPWEVVKNSWDKVKEFFGKKEINTSNVTTEEGVKFLELIEKEEMGIKLEVEKPKPIKKDLLTQKLEAARKKAESKVDRNIPKTDKNIPIETRGKGEIFHGSPVEITSPSSEHYSSLNYYGQGFYTTDALDIAKGYASRKGKAKKPTLYKVTERQPVKLFDIEQPIPTDMKTSLEKMPYHNALEEGLSKDPNQTLRELYDEMRDVDMSADEIQGEFEIIQHLLEKKGYEGLKHIGGLRTKNKPHEVKIYFNPEKSLKIDKIDVGKYGQKTKQSIEKPTTRQPVVLSNKVKFVSPSEKAPPPPKEPPAQLPSGEDPASPNKINESTSRYFSEIAAKLDVEYPFKKVGAPKTGFAVKNYYDQITKHIEQGEYVNKQIKKLKLTPEQLSNAVLQAESAKPPKDPQERKAWLMMRSYFDKSLSSLKELGVLQKGFHERLASNILADIKALDDQIRIARSAKDKLRLAKEQKELTEQLKEMANLRFVSIPVRTLFQDKMRSDPALTRRAIKFLNKKRRKTLTLQDLVDSGLVKKSELNPHMIISPYSRRLGRDVALAKVIKSAKDEGLASLTPKEGYVNVPGYVAPELSKYYIHPAFADYIQAYTNPGKFSLWQSMSAKLKGYSFYNPAILSMNDIVQQAMVILGKPQNLLKLPKNYIKAVKSFIAKDDFYWSLFDGGLFSSPFVMKEKDFKSLLFNLKKDGNSYLLMKILKLPLKLHDAIYDALSAISWGGDKIIRMVTVLDLLGRGIPFQEACQTAALFHGDYAKVPAATRRQLNKIFWTPTFKIVMGIMQGSLMKSAFKIGAAVFKGKKVDPATKAKFGGLIGGFIVLAGIDAFLIAKGFEREVFGLRYKKTIYDENGRKKEMHINLSNPINLIFKFIHRAYSSATEIGAENNFLSFLRKNRYELGIPIQIGWELFSNKTRGYKNIYEPYDSLSTRVVKVTDYITKRVLPFYGITDKDEGFVNEESKHILYEELGRFSNIIPGIFSYVSQPEEVRKIYKVKSITRNFIQKAKRLQREGKSLSEKEKEEYRNTVKKIMGE